MTYSIVARDPETGELGVAVQTRWPMVGAAVPWVRAGVGAVATQASTNVGLGPMVLEFLGKGRSADAALRAALVTDPDAAVRQLAVVDGQGRAAAHTGDRCVSETGHATGPGVSVQGNMLTSPGIPEAMLEAFGSLDGDLAERMLAALRAAEAAGGDVRGRQSAALIVAPGGTATDSWARRFDLRVDDSATPLGEAARLLRVERAFEGLDTSLALAESGAFEGGLEGTARAFELAREDTQIAFWHGVVLLASGQEDAGRSLLISTLRAEPGLALFAARSAEAEPESALAPTLREAARLV